MTNPDPTKPTPNAEKFKPANVTDPVSNAGDTSRGRKQSGDTGGNDVPAGSSGQTKQTPPA
ncbi:MAG: hypothetical protein WA954_03795 [Parerythrobacter sp.]